MAVNHSDIYMVTLHGRDLLINIGNNSLLKKGVGNGLKTLVWMSVNVRSTVCEHGFFYHSDTKIWLI